MTTTTGLNDRTSFSTKFINRAGTHTQAIGLYNVVRKISPTFTTTLLRYSSQYEDELFKTNICPSCLNLHERIVSLMCLRLKQAR
jgi:hypothetical protein